MPAEPAARVFFALWTTPAVAGQLGEIARLEATRLGGRATRPETIHITLAFVGDVPESRLPELIGAARRVTGAASMLNVDRLGYWRHNHLCWAGCSAVPPALADLAAALRQQLRAAGFDVERRGDDFVPHATLVRKARTHAPAGSLEAPLAWPIREFVLVRSELRPEGPAYRRLAAFPLAG